MEGEQLSVNRQLEQSGHLIFKGKDQPIKNSLFKALLPNPPYLLPTPWNFPFVSKAKVKEAKVESAVKIQRLVSPPKQVAWKFADVSTVLIPESVFRGVVSWIDCKGNLYFYEENWAEQVKNMRRKMKEMFNGSQPTAFDLRCKTGHSCIARYLISLSYVVKVLIHCLYYNFF